MAIKRPGCFRSKEILCEIEPADGDQKKLNEWGQSCRHTRECMWKVPQEELSSDLGKMPDGRGKMLRSR